MLNKNILLHEILGYRVPISAIRVVLEININVVLTCYNLRLGDVPESEGSSSSSILL